MLFHMGPMKVPSKCCKSSKKFSSLFSLPQGGGGGMMGEATCSSYEERDYDIRAYLSSIQH